MSDRPALFRKVPNMEYRYRAQPHPDAFWTDKYGWMESVETEDILLVDRKEYGPGVIGARVGSDDSLFVDADHEIATSLPPGRYAIVRLDDE